MRPYPLTQTPRRRTTRALIRFVGLAGVLTGVVSAPGLASAHDVLEVPQASPRASVSQRVGITDFSLEYSSPAVKGRKIWGTLVPFDQVWRTGANAATKLTVSGEFTVGGTKVPAGTYALYTIPGKTQWTFILSSNVNAWGAFGYDAKSDVVRVTAKPEVIPQRERMTFVFSETADDSVRLDLEWEKVRVSLPIKVDTKPQVMAAIEKATQEAWRPHFLSARWMLENGGDLAKALALVDTSIAVKPTWWNMWVKAQIQGKQGSRAEAVASGEKTLELGKGDNTFESFFKADVSKAVEGWKRKS